MVQSVAVTEHAGGNKKPVWARPDRLINVYCVNVDFGHKNPVVLLVIRVSFLGCRTQPGNDTPQRELTQRAASSAGVLKEWKLFITYNIKICASTEKTLNMLFLLAKLTLYTFGMCLASVQKAIMPLDSCTRSVANDRMACISQEETCRFRPRVVLQVIALRSCFPLKSNG